MKLERLKISARGLMSIGEGRPDRSASGPSQLKTSGPINLVLNTKRPLMKPHLTLPHTTQLISFSKKKHLNRMITVRMQSISTSRSKGQSNAPYRPTTLTGTYLWTESMSALPGYRGKMRGWMALTPSKNWPKFSERAYLRKSKMSYLSCMEN